MNLNKFLSFDIKKGKCLGVVLYNIQTKRREDAMIVELDRLSALRTRVFEMEFKRNKLDSARKLKHMVSLFPTLVAIVPQDDTKKKAFELIRSAVIVGIDGLLEEKVVNAKPNGTVAECDAVYEAMEEEHKTELETIKQAHMRIFDIKKRQFDVMVIKGQITDYNDFLARFERQKKARFECAKKGRLV
jgi:hypothetical protein